jgi:hypothetical protein
MTPFAVTQRAARLAPELDRVLRDWHGVTGVTLATEDVLTALWHAGLTLNADLGPDSGVYGALERLGVSPTGPGPKR